VLNKEAVRKAISFGAAVNATINKRSVFNRKNYFYPDGVTVIEWAENGGYLLPKNLIEIEILKVSENSRKIVIKGNNKRELEIIEGL